MQCQIEPLNGNCPTKEGTVTKVATTHILRSAPVKWDKYQIYTATRITTLSSNRIPKALTLKATHSALSVVDIHNKFFRESTIYVESCFLGSSEKPQPATISPFSSTSNHKGHLSNVHYLVKYPCLCFKTVHSHSAAVLHIVCNTSHHSPIYFRTQVVLMVLPYSKSAFEKIITCWCSEPMGANTNEHDVALPTSKVEMQATPMVSLAGHICKGNAIATVSGVNVIILYNRGTLEETNVFNLLPSTFVKGTSLATTHHEDITACSSHTNVPTWEDNFLVDVNVGPLMVIVPQYIDSVGGSGHSSTKEVRATLCNSLLFLGDRVQNWVTLQWSVGSHVSVAIPGDVFPRKGEHNITMPLQTPTLPGYYFSDFIAPTIVYKQFLFSSLPRPTFSHGISIAISVFQLVNLQASAYGALILAFSPLKFFFWYSEE